MSNADRAKLTGEGNKWSQTKTLKQRPWETLGRVEQEEHKAPGASPLGIILMALSDTAVGLIKMHDPHYWYYF